MKDESELKIERANPFLSFLLSVVGYLAITAGVVLCVKLWPRVSLSGSGYETIAYISSLAWPCMAIFSGLMLVAVAEIGAYLAQIRNRAESIEVRIAEVLAKKENKAHPLEEESN